MEEQKQPQIKLEKDRLTKEGKIRKEKSSGSFGGDGLSAGSLDERYLFLESRWR